MISLHEYLAPGTLLDSDFYRVIMQPQGWYDFLGLDLRDDNRVSVVAARDTLGCRQTGKARAIVIVDDRATPAQREALVKLARKQGGELVAQVVHVEAAPIELDLCPCKEDGCAILTAGKARIETRCLNAGHDKVCGNESAFYPPLTGDVTLKPAMAVEHTYAGKGAGARWSEANRRGAYLGSFAIR